MKGPERRKNILHMLSTTPSPLSGTFLADHFCVSRQVIVQDMALIRAEGHDVISTNRGYLLHAPAKVTRTVKCYHGDDEIAEELHTIVDLGGTAEDVFVRHRVYGTLQARLNIHSRRDVQKFLEEIKSGKSTPLKDVTSGYHYHTISADCEETLNLITTALQEKGFLAPQKQ